MDRMEWISFNHILRELNEMVDKISKEVLSLEYGAFIVQEFVDNKFFEEMNFHL
jgi:hypothetical protein